MDWVLGGEDGVSRNIKPSFFFVLVVGWGRTEIKLG